MFFIKKLFGSTKEQMAAFLDGHARYKTMGPSSAGTSYANVCKVHSLGLRGSQLQKANEVLQLEGLHELISNPIRRFMEETNGLHTVAFNGRSNGHLVLYSGEYYDPGFKSYCKGCGQRTFLAVAEGSQLACPACASSLTAYKRPPQFHRVHSSGIDQGMAYEDFLGLDLQALRQKYELVNRFDEVCDQVRSEFISLLDDYIVIEEQVMVPRMVKRLARI